MRRELIVRCALWVSAPANLAVAALILFPASTLGQFVGLPEPAPHWVYRSLLALFLALFGGAYAWLALQPQIHRPLLALSAIGKFGAFAITLALWTRGLAADRWMMLMAGDLLLAGAFAWGLLARDDGKLDSA